MPPTPEQELILALDVAHQSIKVVAAVRAGGKTVYKRAGIVSTMRKGTPASLADILYVMKETTAPWNFQPTSVRVALSGNAITVRFVSVAKMTKEQLLAEIKQDSGKYIPVPLADTYIDCDIFPPSPGGKTGEKNIAVIAAVKRDAVADLSKLLRGMNISAMLLDVSALAVFNAFETYGEIVKTKGFKNYALIDIGSHTSHCAILKEGVPVFLRELTVGGSQITEVLAQGMSLEMEKAEASKKASDSALPMDTMKPVFQLLTDEISNSCHFFETETTTGVDGVFLTGGAALTPGLATYIHEQLETPVEIWNPFESTSIELEEGMVPFKAQGPMFSVCCGLVSRTDKL